ncbi:Hypothetical predicted protein [Octopus vulgaris]|uniref:Uncharacterized protein n=1 Tax=Octopus vulgaris TaxID=6645 RepID=A0AA36AK31_OCTVU|nr:Hypothetical predicted protein [Octopus vulgaris]
MVAVSDNLGDSFSGGVICSVGCSSDNSSSIVVWAYCNVGIGVGGRVGNCDSVGGSTSNAMVAILLV